MARGFKKRRKPASGPYQPPAQKRQKKAAAEADAVAVFSPDEGAEQQIAAADPAAAQRIDIAPPIGTLPPDSSNSSGNSGNNRPGNSNRPGTNRPGSNTGSSRPGNNTGSNRPGNSRPPITQPQPRPPVVQPLPQPLPPGAQQPNLPVPYGETAGRGSCYIRNSGTSASQLQQLILMELRFRLSLQALARRNRRYTTLLNNLAGETLQQARQLAAAYYFITGSRYWPTNVVAETPNRDYAGEANRLYNRAREIDEAYRNAAERTRDRCLASLYNQLGDIKLSQAAQLREIMRRV